MKVAGAAAGHLDEHRLEGVAGGDLRRRPFGEEAPFTLPPPGGKRDLFVVAVQFFDQAVELGIADQLCHRRW